MDDPTPWRRFKAELTKQIEAGVLEPGDEVPLVLEAHDFGVNRFTARKAFNELVKEGKLLPPAAVGDVYRVPPGPDCGRRGNCHWPRCRLPDGSCDEARNCVN